MIYGFPWGEGELAGIAGPREWQREELGADRRPACESDEERQPVSGEAGPSWGSPRARQDHLS